LRGARRDDSLGWPFLGKYAELAADFRHRLRVDLAAELAAGKLHLGHIDRLEEHIHHLDAHGQLAIAQPVQQRLEDMRGFSDLVEAEGGAAALDRMRSAENRVERVLARSATSSSSSSRSISSRSSADSSKNT